MLDKFLGPEIIDESVHERHCLGFKYVFVAGPVKDLYNWEVFEVNDISNDQ